MCAYRQALGLSSFISSYTKCQKKITSCFTQQLNRRLLSSNFPIDNISNLKRNVLLYSYYEKTRLYKYLTLFGAAQLGVWFFYGGFLFVSLRDVSKLDIKNEEVLTQSSLWRRINLGETKYRFISAALCFGIGSLTAVLCYAFPSRIIKELTLHKGGKIASVVTYGPFGRTSHHEVPLKNLSCVISRAQAKSYIAVKIKPRWFYYLVDCKGEFHQPKLFDYTLGTRSVKAY